MTDWSRFGKCMNCGKIVYPNEETMNFCKDCRVMIKQQMGDI